jgi:hypothetical protein
MLRVHLSDAGAAEDLRLHLAAQGFPTALSSEDELEVLFPAVPSIFAPAVELDLWRARHAHVTVTIDPPRP